MRSAEKKYCFTNLLFEIADGSWGTPGGGESVLVLPDICIRDIVCVEIEDQKEPELVVC